MCGGELDPHEMINHDNSIDDDIEYIYEDGREDVKARMEANEIELKKKVKRKKKKPKKEEEKKKGLYCVCVCVYVCVCVCVYVRTYVRTYTCIYIHGCLLCGSTCKLIHPIE